MTVVDDQSLEDGSFNSETSTVAERAERAKAAFAAAVGEEWVIEGEPVARDFSDPYDTLQAPRSRGSYVVQPGSVEEVRQIVRIANEHRVPLWTGSQGRNNGYGGAAPRVPGSVIVNLRRMNKVLEVNETFGYAVVEPGVSFAELNAYLLENDIALWTSVPDLSWGSVLGNTLEHGLGYTPYGEHADQVCGMEIVLADGDLVRTGMGGQSNSKNFHTHQRGFGPRLDEMFMQSNFGIVTKMGLWMQPRPKAWRSVWIHATTDEAGYALVDALRPLLMDGTITNRVLIMNLTAILTALSKKEDWHDSTAPIDDDVRAAMRAAYGLGNWNARIGLYGEPDRMDVDERLIREAVAHIPGTEYVSREYPGDVRHEDVFPPDQAVAGIPNMDLLRMLDWYGYERPGHVGFAPIFPLTSDDAREIHQLLERGSARMGKDYGAAYALTARSMLMLALIIYNAGDPEEVRRTFEVTGEMIAESAAMGYGEYRGHLQFMDRIADQFDFNDHAQQRLNQRLKDALDPRGVLSPGKQGIWPSAGDFRRAGA
ncbi:FAD-binding oxidoreductase [Streptomyces sp. UH6]|uniref:FAD-binding oxidoreductase n=1 Tax=Streptomyces sp. UH6 TaxID=2748379 RepID=UPI0015D48C19|nr:FAD-binding oxidoreductase [Streptomyces sp. UH6]NYV72935.1 FAD-binding oxidoreductase [Streptomyces sp. UH6]